jgi:hypothetical protein
MSKLLNPFSEIFKSNKKIMFPAINDIENLCLDLQLIPPKIINTVKTISRFNTEISVELELNEMSANIYLLINGRKADMFYSVGSGEYTFRGIHLEEGSQIAEVFFQKWERKSPSAFIKLPRT